MPQNALCALILAAGLSTRMRPLLQGSSKALCELDGVSLLGRCCSLFKRSGIERLYVVTGHDHDVVAPAASSLGAVPVYNSQYLEGMFSSIATGLATLMKHDANEAFFLLPVDIPLVRPEIVTTLENHWKTLGQERAETIFLPEVQGTPGHPPLIGRAHWPGILAWNGTGGLQGYIAQMKAGGLRNRPCVQAVPVEDGAVLRDIDTPEDLERARQFVSGSGE